MATLYSAASIMSVPLAAPIRCSSSSSSNTRSLPRHITQPGIKYEMQPSGSTPQVEYEQRKLVSDAVPLYSIPDDVVHGDHGLVRSILLNDRLHALMVDISGEVVMWNVVWCVSWPTPSRGRQFTSPFNNMEAGDCHTTQIRGPAF